MPNVTDEVFIATWTQLGSPQAVADALELDVRGVYRRRNYLVNKGFDLTTKTKSGQRRIVDKEKLQEDLNKRLSEVRHSVRRGIAL